MLNGVEPLQANNASSPIGDSTTIFQDSNEVGSHERPTGMKAAKEKDPMWQEMMNSAAKSQELMEKQHADY